MPLNKLLVKLWGMGIMSKVHCGTGLIHINFTISNRIHLPYFMHRLYILRTRVHSIYYLCFMLLISIPQGSIRVFINDLPSTITFQSFVYCNDTKYYQKIIYLSNIQQIQKNINLLFTWLVKIFSLKIGS